jgi:hypothetical protein
MDETAVRTRIAKLVESGDMTCDEPDQTWAGQGMGKRCAGCFEPIVPPQIEFEVQLPPPDGRTFVLHERCHAIWVEVCDDLRPASSSS